ncbi:MAG: DUF2993 domain-containing protein [Armatimonadota bacterium]
MAAVTVEQVKQGIENYMNRKFKCTDLKVQVVPYANPALLQRGRVQTVVITVKRADKKGIIMNDLYLKATDVTISLDALFEMGKLRTPSRKTATIRATIKESELNEAFGRMKMPIDQFTLKFEKGQVVATGVYKFIFGNKLKMIADLVPKSKCADPTQNGIHFVPQRAWVNGLPLPIGQVRALLSKINPIIDFGSIPFAPEVKKPLIRKDTLTITS